MFCKSFVFHFGLESRKSKTTPQNFTGTVHYFEIFHKYAKLALSPVVEA